ncbi:MAG: amino acid ABC transporter permease [Pseudomonadota bacterium]
MDLGFIVEAMPRLWPGLILTIKLCLTALVIAMAIGLPLGVLRAELGNGITGRALDSYVFLVRGTPILVQIYAAHFLLPMAGIKLDPFWVGIVALVFNSAGYQIEIARGAFISVDHGQGDGAAALGLTRWATLRFVIFPQAVPRMLPPLANEASHLVKASSVLSVLAIFELHKAANAIISQSFKFLEMLAAQAVLYLAFVLALTQLAGFLERRMHRRSGASMTADLSIR